MAYRNKTPFYRLSMFRALIVQASVSVLLASVLAITAGWIAAYSMLLGGTIALIPSAYFTYKAFKYYGARSIAAIVQSLWAGQFGKMVLTAVLFALVFITVKPLGVAALFAGYVVVQLSGLISLFVMKNF